MVAVRLAGGEGNVGRNRSGVLELALLGLLHRAPMHGYELRKRLSSVLGTFRALSFGSLYPCLKEPLAEGLIAEDTEEDDGADRVGPRPSQRARKVYRITAEGKERLQDLLAESGP